MSRFEWKWKSLEMSQEDKCTETLEGDKIGCIYSVMIKMATTTNVQETTEDRRRQKYRKNNPKLVQLSNFKFSAKVSRKRQVDTDFDREYKAKEAARKRRYRAQRIAALLPSQVTMKMMIIVIMVKMMKKMMMVMQRSSSPSLGCWRACWKPRGKLWNGCFWIPTSLAGDY